RRAAHVARMRDGRVAQGDRQLPVAELRGATPLRTPQPAKQEKRPSAFGPGFEIRRDQEAVDPLLLWLLRQRRRGEDLDQRRLLFLDGVDGLGERVPSLAHVEA